MQTEKLKSVSLFHSDFALCRKKSKTCADIDQNEKQI